jgi:predicted dithiol-disulfide oxidoreductase (DUF899 family)
MGVTFPGESTAYREARNRLLEQEIELRRLTEAVAVARRVLPPGGLVAEDYVFDGAGPDGLPTEIRLSEVFAPGRDALVIYSFMFPRAPGDDRPGPTAGETSELSLEDGPCPSCVALLDQLDGVVEHASPYFSLAVVAKAPLPRLLTFGRERGWRRLRLVSSAGNTYNRDYRGEMPDGVQQPRILWPLPGHVRVVGEFRRRASQALAGDGQRARTRAKPSHLRCPDPGQRGQASLP